LSENGYNTKKGKTDMNRIFEYIFNGIPYMLCSVPFIVIIRVITFLIRKKKPQNWFHEVGLLLFVMFCVGVASQTFIPKIEYGNTTNFIINQNVFGEINLIPGKIFSDTYHEWILNHDSMYLIINFIGNICLFLPIGFFISLLWENESMKKTVLISFIMTLSIELLQLPQARGTDIDDLWINVLGAALGYFIYKILSKSSFVRTFFCKFKK